LVNRDLVRVAARLFIVGGGNVGLIAGYHALQAGIEVVGLVEALPDAVATRSMRTSWFAWVSDLHVAYGPQRNGEEAVDSVTIARIDENWRAVPGTERSFACDTVLIAVGLIQWTSSTTKRASSA